MEKIEYKNRAGQKRFKPKLTEVEFRRANNDSLGWCLGCGTEAAECEPDTRQRRCESCDEPLVYGYEELLIMGLIELEEEAA